MNTRTSWLGLAGLVGVSLATATPALAEDVKLGALAGITGPIATMAPAIMKGAELAVSQVNAQGGILGGRNLKLVTGDSACNPQSAVDSANKLINVEQVVAIFGAMCSGAHMAAANSVAVPAGVVMVSGTATSPDITNLKDNDLAFRVVPSDSFQGAASARNLLAKGVKKVAVTYINNDYGKGLAKSFVTEFEAKGGTVTANLAHEEKKASYRSELATLASGGADTLVVYALGGDSGMTIIRQSLENAYFEKFVGGDGMKDNVLLSEIGAENLGGLLVTAPSSAESKALSIFRESFKAFGGDPNGVFVGNGYDAGFVLALAIEKAGSADRSRISAALRAVASAPGEPILPGEWKKAVALLKAGKDIDYQGVTGDHEFDKNGDVAGVVAEVVVKDGAFVETGLLK
jgi:branched-chain amino acid transport system substrate-binding protein